MVKRRHLGGFTSNERTTRFQTSIGDTLDDIGSGRYFEVATGIVIEEEEGFSTLNNEIVDRHGNEIDTYARTVGTSTSGLAERLPRDFVRTNSIVLSVILSNLQFCSNSISSRNEDRILEPSRLQIEQSTESTNDRICSYSLRGLDEWLDLLDEGVTGIDRNSC